MTETNQTNAALDDVNKMIDRIVASSLKREDLPLWEFRVSEFVAPTMVYVLKPPKNPWVGGNVEDPLWVIARDAIGHDVQEAAVRWFVAKEMREGVHDR